MVPYLTRPAAFGTLQFIASMPRGSGVVFDYSIPREMLGEVEQQAFDLLAERVARAGEPFRLFFDPAQLETELQALGFTEIETLDIGAIRARWFGTDTQGSRATGRSGRLLCAQVE